MTTVVNLPFMFSFKSYSTTCRLFLSLNKIYLCFQDRPEVAVCGYSGRKFIQKKFYNPKEHGPSITYEEYLAEMEAIKS